MTDQTPVGLALLRKPFPPHQIRQRSQGGIMLDYVGHAALTDRLLDADPCWSWEPLATGADGLPLFDAKGGLWIRLTVCGVTRLGYGNAKVKPQGEPGNREKEVIGDALRNAAMRFGAALELWHKGDLHVDGEPEPRGPVKIGPRVEPPIDNPMIDPPDYSAIPLPMYLELSQVTTKEQLDAWAAKVKSANLDPSAVGAARAAFAAKLKELRA